MVNLRLIWKQPSFSFITCTVWALRLWPLTSREVTLWMLLNQKFDTCVTSTAPLDISLVCLRSASCILNCLLRSIYPNLQEKNSQKVSPCVGPFKDLFQLTLPQTKDLNPKNLCQCIKVSNLHYSSKNNRKKQGKLALLRENSPFIHNFYPNSSVHLLICTLWSFHILMSLSCGSKGLFCVKGAGSFYIIPFFSSALSYFFVERGEQKEIILGGNSIEIALK